MSQWPEVTKSYQNCPKKFFHVFKNQFRAAPKINFLNQIIRKNFFDQNQCPNHGFPGALRAPLLLKMQGFIRVLSEKGWFSPGALRAPGWVKKRQESFFLKMAFKSFSESIWQIVNCELFNHVFNNNHEAGSFWNKKFFWKKFALSGKANFCGNKLYFQTDCSGCAPRPVPYRQGWGNSCWWIRSMESSKYLPVNALAPGNVGRCFLRIVSGLPPILRP